jgi:uncharacterized protein
MMLTELEEQQLSDFLKLALVPSNTLTLDGVQGLLFGLAIAPDLITPDDLLPMVYGMELADFDERQANQLFAILFGIYSRFMQENQAGTLAFPFDIAKLTRNDIPKIREWCQGLMRVLSVEPELWGITEHEPDPAAITEEEQELSTSIAIVSGIAYPEHAAEIFRDETFEDVEKSSESSLQGKVFFFLPMAVDYIQQHGGKLRKETMKRMQACSGKPGRNDPCPCNSGKKYKKCCGA